MKIYKIITFTLSVQFLLTWISLSKDIHSASIQNATLDIVGLYITTAFWSILSAIFILSFKKGLLSFLSKFVFFLISIFNILVLLWISYGVITEGPLNESGLIFIVFPIYGFFLFIGGAILGTIIYFIKNKIQQRNIQTKH